MPTPPVTTDLQLRQHALGAWAEVAEGGGEGGVCSSLAALGLSLAALGYRVVLRRCGDDPSAWTWGLQHHYLLVRASLPHEVKGGVVPGAGGDEAGQTQAALAARS